ncbi:MAG: hypothetical protein D6781_12335 [Verrucomicrobia bacterium]|nr:MAG: hypothetical protein D6781_12335 [Verrucomicrobiota bacterium]
MHPLTRPRLRASIVLPTIFALFAWVTQPPPLTAGEDQPIRLDQPLQLPLPPQLKTLPLNNPHARILIDLDEAGVLVDVMPIEATHCELLEPALKAVRDAPFIPAREDGRPVRSQAMVYVSFFDIEQEAWRQGTGILPFGGNVSDAIESRFYRNMPSRYAYGESRPDELDAPLQIVASKIRLYTSEEGVRQKGTCLVEYFVGPDGNVHFPRIIHSDHDDLSMSALLTLQVTRFAPPKRHGNPTCVKVRQPFNFH